MDFGVSGIGSTPMVSDEVNNLQEKLKNHEQELSHIEKKLGNPQVPRGKKEKLIFRAKTLSNKVIPRVTKELNKISLYV